MKLAKAKQHPDTERLLFENYSLSSSTLSSKNNCILKNIQKTSASVLITSYENEAMPMKMRLKKKNG